MLEIVLSGMFGGLSVEILFWWSRRDASGDSFPPYAKQYSYWIATILMIIFSGVLVWLYQRSGIDLKPIVAFNIGASTPSIISALTKAAPPTVKVDDA